jgi:hypothetical protein
MRNAIYAKKNAVYKYTSIPTDIGCDVVRTTALLLLNFG